MIDISTGFSNFHELVPAMARQFPFELDVFQKQAVYHLEQGDSVFVAAHTSAGKTVVAEYAIALSMKHMTKTIYTSPIKALSNQKFRDFCKTFGDDNVGILTGDIQIRPEAPCVVMTTEILRSMLYRGADIIRDIEYVVFDEVHYVNDLERGVVWEEVIIMLPAHVSLILLSATVPNTREFADWVGRTKKKDIYVISTLYRPVPLEHYLFAGGALHKVVDAKRQLLTGGWKAANDAIAGDAKLEKQQQQQQQQQRGGSGGGSRGGRGGGGGGGGGAVVRTGGGPMDTRAKQDRTLYAQLVSYLRKHELLPVVVFTFSRRRCEENAGGLTNVDLLGSSQKSEVHVFIEKSLQRLKPADRTLPQIVRMRDLLGRGIAVHHGGLLPIIKEIVEILFARGLVKVLFATETFAMGVNFPARSVVFSSLRKHDGRTFRELLPGEYTQMSGRAGRRGLDATGVVIIMCQPGGGGGFGGFGRGGSGSDGAIPDTTTLTTMILGPSTKLVSQFRLTYTMILNLLRVEQLKVEEMIKRSFSENTAQKQLPEQQRALEDGRRALERLERQMECVVCRPDIGMYHSLCVRVSELTQAMLEMALASPVGYRALAGAPGRIVVLAHANPLLHGCFAVILRPSAERVIVSSGAAGGTTGQVPAALHCLVLMDAESSTQYQQEQLQQQQRAVAGSGSESEADNVDDVDADDTLPLVPPVLEWPRALDPAMARHAVVAVELSNIGFVVDSSLRVPELAAAATEPVGAKHSEAWERACVAVRDELVRTASSLFTAHADDGAAIEDSHAGLDRLLALEYPFAKLRDLEFKRRYAERRLQLHRLASAFGCRGCPDLAAHLQLTHREQTLRARLAALVHAMSDQNLELLPDYRQRLHVLRRLGFIAPIQTYESRRRQQQQQQHGGGGGDNGDDDGALAAGLDAVQLKGRIGCEIHAADELILTELVLSNFFADLAPEEAAALLSAFVCHEKSDYEPVLTPRLELGARQMVETAERIVAMERECGLYSSASLTSAADSAAASAVSAPAAAQSTDSAAGAELAPAMSDMATEVASRMRFTLTEVVYEWARGMPFTQLMSLTDVQEGHIVRCIVRLDDVCTEVRDAAWIIGDRALFAKMQQASAMIKRDIVFAASLYFDKAFAMRSANLSAKAAVATIESAAAAAAAATGDGSGTDAAKSRGAARK